MKNMFISVVVPSYNQPKTISRCIESILRQNWTAYEIIIVDSSSEKHQQFIEKKYKSNHRIKLVKLKTKTYPGVARNLGVEKAKGNVLAFTDSDCIVCENWLSTIASHIKYKILLTGMIRNGTKCNIVGTCSFLIEFSHYIHTRHRKKEITFAPSGNLACSKKFFNHLGGFSDYRAFEDVLFSKKAIENEGTIYQIRELCIEHINRTKIKDVCKNQKLLGQFSAIVRSQNNLPPRVILKYPLLSFGLAGFRYISILTRVWRSRHIISFALYTPIILYILIWWSTGFYVGSKNHEQLK